MGIWLIALLVVGTPVVLALKALARKSLVRDRTPQPLTDLHAEVRDQVSIEVFSEVWTKIGDTFSIDSRLIRPNDTLRTLFNIDSWDLGEGEEALGRWIEREGLGTPPKLATVLDLAKWVQTSRASTEHG